jgi:hypothetical protein
MELAECSVEEKKEKNRIEKKRKEKAVLAPPLLGGCMCSAGRG